MGQIQPLHPAAVDPATAEESHAERPVASIVRCELCGVALPDSALRFAVVSPRRRGAPIITCHTCRNAALGEGYRPVS